MTRYIQDQNKVVLFAESGTYGVISGPGIWVGEVTEHSIDDAENLLVDRFLGANTRSVAQWVGGPRDVTGTITYNAQDVRLPFMAIGSIVDGGTTNKYTHLATQVPTSSWQNPWVSGTGQLNAPLSFGIEDSKTAGGTGSVFLRTIQGCVIDSLTLTAAQGEKVKVEANYLAQNMTYSGGTSSTSIISSGTTPYLWSNCTLTVSGTNVQTAKEVSLEIANNVTGPHYLNGSRDISTPYPGNRDNTLSITYDLDATAGTLIYDLYKRNATFNSIFDMNADVTATGSAHAIFFLSGCKVNKCEVPSTIEGTVETTAEIVCPILIGSAFDTIAKYGYW